MKMAMETTYLDRFREIDFSRITEHPNILVAASFWDRERYEAARNCYRMMRKIDDLIDDYKSLHAEIEATRKPEFYRSVCAWLDSIRSAAAGSPDPSELQLADTLIRFHIPLWAMEDFTRAMMYDIGHSGFSTLEDFLAYCEGASIAPASIFVHLCGLSFDGEQYHAPAFDVKEAATPCAMFSYLVHIIRDFQKDQHNHLNYFATDVLERNGLSHPDLYEFAHGRPLTQNFRNMIEEYRRMAEKYMNQTHDVISRIGHFLEPRYLLSLHIIFNLYLMVYERIDTARGTFLTGELNPSPEEVKRRVYRSIAHFSHDANVDL